MVGFEGKYEVSNYGRVASLNYNHTGKWQLLRQIKDKDGYMFVNLYKNGNQKQPKVHHLVAEDFPEICGTYFEGAEIDHINTIRDDNRASNLRWCTRSENQLNQTTRKRKSNIFINHPKMSKPVLQFTKDGTFIAEYQSINEAYRQTKIQASNISQCCKGKIKSSGGFGWKYKETEVA